VGVEARTGVGMFTSSRTLWTALKEVA